MSLVLKIMTGADGFDDNAEKECRIVANVCEVNMIHRDVDKALYETTLYVNYAIPNSGLMSEEFVLRGNAYLMAKNGKTINTFSCKHS